MLFQPLGLHLLLSAILHYPGVLVWTQALKTLDPKYLTNFLIRHSHTPEFSPGPAPLSKTLYWIPSDISLPYRPQQLY